MNTFLEQYIATALWSSTDPHGEPLDGTHGVDDISPELLATMTADCAKFETDNADDITDGLRGGRADNDSQAGHDFWLTRNRHGAGFWDGDWCQGYRARLTSAAEGFGEYHLYVGDDDKIYGGA